MAKGFGKSAGFGSGLLFPAPICFRILAFGDVQDMGPISQSDRQ